MNTILFHMRDFLYFFLLSGLFFHWFEKVISPTSVHQSDISYIPNKSDDSFVDVWSLSVKSDQNRPDEAAQLRF